MVTGVLRDALRNVEVRDEEDYASPDKDKIKVEDGNSMTTMKRLKMRVK